MRIRRIAKMFFIVELINVNDVKENDYLKPRNFTDRKDKQRQVQDIIKKMNTKFKL